MSAIDRPLREIEKYSNSGYSVEEGGVHEGSMQCNPGDATESSVRFAHRSANRLRICGEGNWSKA